MKNLKYVLLIAATLLCLLPVTAMAAAKQSEKINFSDPVVISGTHIAPGSYTVRWDGAGPDVKVQILKNKKELVSAPAKLINQHNEYSPAIVTKSASDGSTTVTEIGLSNITLRFSE